MLRTFKAFLQDGRLEWIDDLPHFGNERLQVYVTVLENDADSVQKTRGQRMSELLEYLATANGLEGIDPMRWKEEMRCGDDK